MDRTDKLLVRTGRWSRKEARLLCRQGRVTADGTPVQAEEKIREGAVLAVDGQPVEPERNVWLMLHKPAGLLSATEDPRQPTVLSLLPARYQKLGLFPVGRLDKDTEGLLLLTNDGALAHDLLSPKKHVDKVYYVEVEGELTGEDAAAFAAGMVLGDGLHCLPARLHPLGGNRGEVTLREGKYHQVKRMLASLGKPVRYLKRVAFGPLSLDGGLERGAWRPLTQEEKAALAGEKVAPGEKRVAPAEEKGAPVGERAAPVGEKAAPAEEKAAPVGEKAAPVEEKAAPAEEKAAPVGEKAAPVEEMSAPAEEKGVPVGEKSAQVGEKDRKK